MGVFRNIFFMVLTCFVNRGTLNGEPIYPDFTCPDICKCNLEVAATRCKNLGLTNLTNVLIHPMTIILDLSHNKLNVIPKELLPLTNLQYLHLENNHIAVMTANDLKSLKNLRVLDLSNNQFGYSGSIEMTFINTLKKLHTLNLSHNRLYNLHDFQKINSEMRTLNIANCSINNFYFNILNGFKNMKSLNLSMNPLQDIHHLESKSLTILTADDCNIQNILPVDLIGLPSLVTITLSRNYHLKTFNTDINSIALINMADCSLNEVPTIHSSQLTTLNLYGNRILEIKGNAFQNMSNLRTLILRNNIITTVDVNAFEDLSVLNFLDLSFNRINEIKPDTFNSTKNLTQLQLSHNYIKGLQFKAPALRVLDASHCEIKTILDRDLVDLPKLQVLNISYNWLSVLPNNLVAPKLETLDLSMCGIWILNNQTFAQMKELRRLNLKGNRLSSSIGKEVFHDINVVYLSDNPWRCDCENPGFYNLFIWITEFNRQADYYELLCRSPAKHEGKHWKRACEIYWNVTNNPTWMYILVGIVLCSIVLCILWHFIQRRMAKNILQRAEAVRQEERQEAQARLRRMRQDAMQAREGANRNAPDPRDIENPPNYNDAILLAAPTRSTSSASLSQFRVSTCTPENRKGSRAKESKRRPLRPRSAILHNYNNRVGNSKYLQQLQSQLDTTTQTPSSIVSTSEIELDYEIISNNTDRTTDNIIESSV